MRPIIKLSSALILSLFSSLALAENDFLPTELQGAHDCVSPVITAAMNPAQEALARTRCALVEMNVNKPQKIQTCIDNSLIQKTFTFFFATDCNSDGPFELSLNGLTHRLKLEKHIDSAIPVTGIYKADDLTVQIDYGQLIKQEFEDDTDEKGKPVKVLISAEHEVFVTVQGKDKSAKFRGVYLEWI
jgi:hypothetical protein